MKRIPDAARAALVAWFRPRRHAYAWRRGRTRDPWMVLVSEVMLQQTQAARVEAMFEAFLRRFPDPRSMAAASRGDVLRAWGRLGYPRRALALHGAATAIVRHHGGEVPPDPGVLRTLPGVGAYTAAAVASLAHGLPVPAIDTNVRRIVARVGRGLEPDEVGASALLADAEAWLDRARPGRWNEALMDLGRDRCRPIPRCDGCPLRPWCRAAARTGRPRRPVRSRPRYDGSVREARGSVLAVLRERRTAIAPDRLVALTGLPSGRVRPAVDGLIADGLIECTARGRLRLPA